MLAPPPRLKLMRVAPVRSRSVSPQKVVAEFSGVAVGKRLHVSSVGLTGFEPATLNPQDCVVV
jgi:hypothetical protein